MISYTTQAAASLPSNERAESLQDFVPAAGDVVMGDGVTSATVPVTILPVLNCYWHNITTDGVTVVPHRITLQSPTRAFW